LSERSNRTGNTLALIGRLAAGATPASAQAEAAALATAVRADRLNGFEPVARPLREHVSGAFRPAVVVLIGAVGLVMLIVCANLSNLLLARGAVREREMAIRAAMGAPRRRLVRQMLVEALLLSGGGCALGLVLAYLAIGVVAGLDVRIPLLGEARVDTAALTVTVMTALATGILFGIAPAVRSTDPRLHEALKDSARGSSHSRRKGSLRSLLVLSEIALAALLLAVSTLMVRSFLHLLDVDLGYRAERAIAIRIDPAARFDSDPARVAFYSEMLDAVRTLPGVAAAGLSDILPMGFNRTWSLRAMDRHEDDSVYPYVRIVSDGYVAAMGLSLIAGRDLGPDDGPDGRRVALVNEKTAQALWPSGDALGRTVRSSGREYTVVGVVRDTRQLSVDQAPGLEIFFPIRQLGDHSAVHLILRGDPPLGDLVSAARARIRSVAPGLPLDEVVPIQGIVDASLGPRRFLVALITGFATFALLLASLGIYGVISYSVTQRRREIGIHMALGASADAVRWRILKETLVLTALGLPVGLLGALLTGWLLQSLLFGVTPLDPVTYGAVVAMLGCVAVAAGYVPARRAAAANPVEALSARPRAAPPDPTPPRTPVTTGHPTPA
jgi:predicted permease